MITNLSRFTDRQRKAMNGVLRNCYSIYWAGSVAYEFIKSETGEIVYYPDITRQPSVEPVICTSKEHAYERFTTRYCMSKEEKQDLKLFLEKL